MLRLWKWYQNCLATRPLQTQAITTGFIWGSTEIGSQNIAHYTTQRQSRGRNRDEGLKVSWDRVSKWTVIAVVFAGPCGHIWFTGLDYFVKVILKRQPKSFSFVAEKVAIDLVLKLNFVQPEASRELKGWSAELKLKGIKMLSGELEAINLWSAVRGVVVYRYIPVQYQVLCVNLLFSVRWCFEAWKTSKVESLNELEG